jgi:hypothetical protein
MLVGAFVLMYMPARSRVQRAPGLPRALYILEGQRNAKLGCFMPREREVMFSCITVIASAAKQSSSPQ